MLRLFGRAKARTSQTELWHQQSAHCLREEPGCARRRPFPQNLTRTGTPPRLPPRPVLRSMEAAFRALGALEPRGPAGQSLTRPAPAAPPPLILIAKE